MFRDRVLKRKIRNAIFFILVVIIIISAYKNIRDSRADETTAGYGQRIYYFDAQFTDTNNETIVENEKIIATSNLDGNYSIFLPKEIDGRKVLKYHFSDELEVEINQQDEIENKIIILSEEQIVENTIVGSIEFLKEDENTETPSNKKILKKLGEFDNEKLENDKIVIDNISQNFAKDQTTAYITSILELSKENIGVLYNGENELEQEKFEIEKLEECIWKDVNEEAQSYKITINEASARSVNQLKIELLAEDDEPIEVIINGNISNKVLNTTEDNNEESSEEEPTNEENNEEKIANEENSEEEPINEENNEEEITNEESSEEDIVETENQIVGKTKTEFVLFNMLKSTSEERTAESNFLGISIERKNIQKIVFTDDVNEEIEEKYDVSSTEDNSIIAWLEENIVYIYSENIINTNYDSSFLFSNINAPIEGLEKIYTYTTINMDYMFKDYGNIEVAEINFAKNFDTSKVQTMRGMFKNCGTEVLEKISFGENFVTSNVTDMSEMFENCGTQSLVQIDLGDKFIAKNTTVINNMFENCGNNETKIYCGLNIFVSENELKANLEKIQIPSAKAECKYYTEWQIELVENNIVENNEENAEENLEENNEEISEENAEIPEVNIGTEIYNKLKTTTEEDENTIKFKVTANAVNTVIKSINLTPENIKVLVDGEIAESITKELIPGENQNEFLVKLSNFEEKKVQSEKSYKEWSGNVSIRIDENTILAENANNSLEVKSEEKFIDTIKPIIKITNSSMKKGKKTIEFSVTDKYFSQSSISTDDITVLIDEELITEEKASKKLTGEAINAEINGENKVIGAQYTLTLTEKEEGALKDECFVTLAFKEGVAEDSNGNKNIATSLSVQMKEIENKKENIDEINEVIIDENRIHDENTTATGNYPMLKTTSSEHDDTSYYLGSSVIQKKYVNSVHFVDGISTANSTKWSVSVTTGEIYAWYTTQTINSTTLYNVYIGATNGGKMYANYNSNNLFHAIGKDSNCNDETCLYGLELLDTSLVTSMESMFYECGYTAMTSLDLGTSFVVNKVTSMYGMFYSCGYTSMKSLNLGHQFNTYYVKNMSVMFYCCGYTSMTVLNLGAGFEWISKESNNSMFSYCGKSGCSLRVPRSIYSSSSAIKIYPNASTTISYSQGTVTYTEGWFVTRSGTTAYVTNGTQTIEVGSEISGYSVKNGVGVDIRKWILVCIRS